ncbi:MAG TPA: hypothetical protein VK894_11870, partial [Jiangellales bacterium]|nr:hypothetical protein [Jiangellales bacterium]
ASLARAERELQRARHALGRVEHADGVHDVTAALAEGGWYLAVTRARLDGCEPGARRPPCFFDPGHGPALTEVTWAPTGGGSRRVPACEDDATLVRQGLVPAFRDVPVGKGLTRAYVDAGRAYGGWAAGYHGAALPALLADTPLGAAVGGQHLLTEGGFDAGGGWAGGRGIEEEPG